MRILKEKFTFNYNQQEIKVEKTGQVYSAIFGTTAKPLKINIHNKTDTHNGSIQTWEGKHLSWIPDTAFEEIDPIQFFEQIKSLLNSVEL